MAKEAQTREIDGTEYTARPLGTEKALEVLQKLGALLGPAFADVGAALNGAKKAGGEVDVDLGKLGAALGSVFIALGPKSITSAARDGLFLGTTFVAGDKRLELMSPKVYDEHFAGDLPLLFKVMAFSAEVQFGSFSVALKRALGALGAAGPKAAAEGGSSSLTS